jgi:hypothetical protein
MARGVRFEGGSALEKEPDPRTELRKQFRERIADGRFDDLLEGPLQRVLQEAAAIRGMDIELGALRFALAKLLAEETDASKLASGLARLTSAIAQAQKVQLTIGNATDASLAALLNEILIDLEQDDAGDERMAMRGETLNE